MANKPYHKEDTLCKLYHEQNLSGVEIAEKFGVSTETIYTWMGKHGIERTGNDTSHLPSSEEIADLYVKEKLSVPAIAEKFGVSRTAIDTRLDKEGVSRRSSGSYQTPDELTDPDWIREKNHREKLRVGEIADLIGCHESAVYNAFRRHNIDNIYNNRPEETERERLRDADLLRRLYYDEKMSTLDIGEFIGVDQSTVYYWFEKHGIETRDQSDITGDLHPRYNPESDQHVYDKEWRQVREKVIQRDNSRCQECGISRQDHKDQHGLDLDVHHIIPQYKVEDKYDMENLITMCRSCHITEEQN